VICRPLASAPWLTMGHTKGMLREIRHASGFRTARRCALPGGDQLRSPLHHLPFTEAGNRPIPGRLVDHRGLEPRITPTIRSVLDTEAVILTPTRGPGHVTICVPSLAKPVPYTMVEWRHRDSNPEPPACKAGALPIAPYPRSAPRSHRLLDALVRAFTYVPGVVDGVRVSKPALW
jgi:hypothetical protein